MTGPTPTLIVPLRSRRRARGQLLQKVQHALPALVLLPDGLARLAGGPGGFGFVLGIAETVVSALVVIAIVRAARGHGHETPAHAGAVASPGHGVDWIDILLAALLVTEAFVHYDETGHVRRPTIVLAVVMVMLGVFHGRIAARAGARRALRITADGISVGGRFFRRLTAAWADVAAIDVGPSAAMLTTRDGRQQRLDLADLYNAGEVRGALGEARARLEAHREAVAAAAAAPARPPA